MDNNNRQALAERDTRNQLHPFTDALEHLENGPLVIDRGEGIYVFDQQGKEYIEGMSGLWSVALGFNNQRLIRAATKQLQQLPFYHLFAHKSHRPSIELADKLIQLAPVPMSKVFFTNSGSEANDTAVKLIWYRNNALGKHQKKKLISRRGAYHGVTVMSASLTGLDTVHKGFDLPLPGVYHLTCPHYRKYAQIGETEVQFSDRLAAELESLILREGPESVAAFFGEPLMGAGGVITPPDTYWEKIQRVCSKHDVLLVADEVICGFGRTGRMFGCETYDIRPDVMILSKQLASSYQPIAAVLVNESVYAPIAEQSHTLGTFGHGFTATGHPVAAAVALENVNIIEEDGLVARARELGELLQEELGRYAAHPGVAEVRGEGLIAAIELVKPAEFQPGTLGKLLVRRAQHHGLIVRSIGDSIAFCPPLISTTGQIRELVHRFHRAFKETVKGDA